MPILNNGNPLQTSTDYVVANPDFNNQKKEKVLAQTTPSESQPGVAAGPVEIGPLSVPFKYYDEAGRYLETTSNHAFPQDANASILNVPASVYSQSVPNVGARFAR